MSTQQARPNRPPKPNLFAILKPYKALTFILIAFALLSNGVNLIIPKIISRGIDSFGHGAFNYRTVAIEFLSATLVIFIFAYLQGILQTLVSERVARDMRTSLSNKISRQDFVYIQQANPSKLLTNLTSDIDSVKFFVAQGFVSIISSLFMIIGASALLISINWKLALAVLTIIPLVGVTFFLIFRKVRVLFKRSREIIDRLNKVINESILGAAIIRVLNSQQLEYNKFLSANSEALGLGLSILKMFATLIPIVNFVGNMAALVILVLGGHFVVLGNMTLGNFAAFNSYLVLLIFPIIVIGFMSNFIAQAGASYQRVKEVLDASEPVEPGVLDNKLQGDVELQNVSVRYGEKYALKEVSLQVKGGTQTAIIGPTAAGKSQLLYLLTALIKPQSGAVLFDGERIENYRKEVFHRQIGLVFQDSILFNLSLRENIAFSDKVSDELLQKAIETAELGEFIESLPDKLDSIVSERGTSLSGGQKQRIMLARALALNPQILLLDDFTARVDSLTERKILQNVRRNYPDITIISVTQKIASIQHYEQIVLLMEGEISGIGTHEELLNSCPEYVQIYNSQKSLNHYETGIR